MKEEQKLIEIIRTKYKTFLEKEGIKSIPDYLCVEKAFELEEVFDSCDVQHTNAAKNFLDLLPTLIKNKNNYLLNLLTNEIEKARIKLNSKELTKSKQNKRSYLGKFMKFIKVEIIPSNENGLLSELILDDLTLSDKELDEIINNKKNKIYLQSQLRTKFKSRLRTQDRVSGDKIWLPLRFIAKIYSIDFKQNQNQNQNLFTGWLNDLADNIFIHYKNNKLIDHFKLSEIDSLVLTQCDDNKKNFKVSVRKGQEDYDVLSPTGEGNMKTPMIVEDIKDIAIDHVKPIDKILRDLENRNELIMLKKVSDSYRALQEDEELDEKKAVDMLLNDQHFEMSTLRNELDKISANGPLRLMSAEYNSKKSNGETFKKIYMTKDDEYWGILEEEVYNGDSKEPEMILCQKLVNNIDDCGKTRVFPKYNIINKNNTDMTNNYNLETNIDYI